MPTRAFIPYSPGSGGKHGASQYTDGVDTKLDSVEVIGEQHLAAYTVQGAAISVATSNDHNMQLMAGASLNVYVRRIMVYQIALATTATLAEFRIFRLTTAGTGGTGLVEAPMGSGVASGAQGMSGVPAGTKGTEGNRLWIGSRLMTQTAPTAGGDALMFDLNFDLLRTEPIIIPAGVNNGIAFKNITAVAAATIAVTIFFSEAPY